MLKKTNILTFIKKNIAIAIDTEMLIQKKTNIS